MASPFLVVKSTCVQSMQGVGMATAQEQTAFSGKVSAAAAKITLGELKRRDDDGILRAFPTYRRCIPRGRRKAHVGLLRTLLNWLGHAIRVFKADYVPLGRRAYVGMS